jgi:hypothetical protein
MGYDIPEYQRDPVTGELIEVRRLPPNQQEHEA